MTDLPDTTPARSSRAPFLPILALAVALLGVALGASAIFVAAGDDTDTVRLPAVRTEHMATMDEHMGGMGGMRSMGMMGAVDVDAMRDRCETRMGELHDMDDAATFCDSMVESMPMSPSMMNP